MTVIKFGNLEQDKYRLQQALENKNNEIEQWRN